MKNERTLLQKELAGYLRERDAAALRLLRAQIHAARVQRRHQLQGARTQCRDARAALQVQQADERRSLVDRQRGERIAERSACSSGKATAREHGTRGELTARQALAEARTLQGQVRRADKKATMTRSTKRERSQEDDDAVRSNLPAELRPVFDKYARRFKAGPRRSRTEAFLEWAEENPDEILAVQQEKAERELAELVKEQRELGRSVRKADRYKQAPEALEKLLAGVPF
jgi:hypothetical protein